MSNELSNPRILICPADYSRQVALNWSALASENCSYEIINGGLHDGDSDRIFLRCKIHGFAGYANDTLQDQTGSLIPHR